MKKNSENLGIYNIAEDYWLKKLKGVTFNPLFSDRENLESDSSTSCPQGHFSFSPRLIDTLDSVSKGSDTNVFLIFITALNILMYKYLQGNDILIGTAQFQDDDETGLNDALLFFRTNIDEQSVPRGLINKTLNQLNDAYKNHLFQYESFLRRFCDGSIRDSEALSALGLIYNRFNRDSRLVEKIHLLFKIQKEDTGLDLFIKYNTGYYTPDQVNRLGRHFMNILASMMENLDNPLQTIDILTPGDKRKLLLDYKGEEIDYHLEEKIFLPGFECQVEKTPLAPALVYEDLVLSYRDLNERANQLARWLLKETPLEADDLAALVMGRSEKMVQSILALWKCGAAYVPVDPDYPPDRIETIIKDAGVKLVMGDTGSIPSRLETPPASVTNIIYPDKIEKELIEEDKTNLYKPAYPRDLAYVIYTSGSTGRPKGVMIEHLGMMNHLHAKIDEIGIDAGSVIAQNASHCFDISVWQFFAALLEGGRTVIYSNRVVLSPALFIKQLENHGVSILEVVPSYLSMMADIIEEQKSNHLFARLNYLLVTGESVKPGLVKRWFEKFPWIKMVNAYGPTEASDDITHFHMDRDPARGSIPIGKTLRNFHIYIVDSHMGLCPPGVKGEICVSGMGIGRGYTNDMEKTREAFIEDLFINKGRVRMYRTGDIGRFLPDGNIEFFGRKDYQVKIRGYRIELEEIENRLAGLEGIGDAVVVDRKGKTDNTYLCGYITFIPGVSKPVAEIKVQLRQALPEYMVPAVIIVLDTLPLTPNGKVDRKALPEPGQSDLEGAEYVAPRSAKEKKLAEIWQQVMGIEKIGIHDDFFALGGNSLLGIRIVNKIQEWLQETVHVTILFIAPSIEKLAAKLESYKIETDTRIDETEITEIRRLIQPLPPLPPHLTVPGKAAPVMFILCPSRSGSTLLRIILAGHPKLFAPQEFELLSFNTLAERNEALTGKFSLYLEGVIRAIMELKKIDADEAKKIMEEFENRDMTVREFYGILQTWLGDRILVEKTPQYTYDIEVLKRAETYLAAPLYIHLVRNPYAVIYSFENARLDQLFKYDHHFSPRQLGELLWVLCNQNIREFLEGIPANRKYRLKYEDLVSNPGLMVSQMCDHFGLEFYPGMLDIYGDAQNRMTDGIYTESKMLGDVKFFSHSSIDTTSVEKWKKKYKTEFLGETAANLAKFFGYLQEPPQYSKIEPAPKKEYYELSPSQRRLWILDRLEESLVAYNIPGAYLLQGDLNIDVLRKAYETAVRRHEILRTTFITLEGKPWQRVHDFETMGFKLEYVDLRDRPEPGEKAKALAGEEASVVFDLERGPLLRVKLIHIDENRYLLLFTMHHIVSDGWSMHLSVKEIMVLYGAYEKNRENPLAPVRFQYRDYSEWLNSKTVQQVLQEQAGYWLKEFAGEIPVLNLPADHPRPVVMSYEGDVTRFNLSLEEIDLLNQVARSGGASLFMVLMAVFKIFLSKISGQEDIVVGIPSAGRNHPELEQIMGMFVNTLALRSYLPGDMHFTPFLNQVRTNVLAAFENQDYPFEELVEKVPVDRDTSRNPLFDAMFSFMDLKAMREMQGIIGSPSNLNVAPYPYRHNTAKFDLTLNARESAEGVFLSFEYSTKLFKKQTIQRFVRYFKQIVSAVIEDKNSKISQIQAVPGEEKRQVLFEFNRTEVDYPGDKTIHRLFEEQVEQTPDRIAVLGTINQLPLQVTYRELNEKSGRLAGLLREKDVQADTIAGIMAERSIEMIIGVFGILKAGSAYLPIDPDYPRERIDFILKDSNAKILLTGREIAGISLPGAFNNRPPGTSFHLHPTPGPATSLAYVIYTSGSTGKPKGVLVEHQGVVNYIKWAESVYVQGRKCVFPFYSSLCFDLTATSLYVPLISGNKIIVYPGDESEFVISTVLDEGKGNIIKLTPTHLKMLKNLDIKEKALKKMIVGGEDLKTQLAGEVYRMFNRNLDIYNEYGPTEATVGCMIYKYNPDKDLGTSVPIGVPINNIKVYLLDNNLAPVPYGVPGELCIAGAGLARGYLNRPGLTAEKFLFIDYRSNRSYISPGKIYRTGDLARWLPEGNIEFLGRIDYQVKIRGFRIELGEIENRLSQHHEIKEAVVLAKTDETGDAYLCAYIIPGKEIHISGLREYLSAYLPDNMIPSYFVRLEEIPLTPNGKIDRRALPEPAAASLKDNVGYVPPATGIERKLVEIWEKVLARDHIGIHENFFLIGGDSIKAIQIISRLNRAGYSLAMNQLFKHPFIANLAPRVEKIKRLPDQSVITGAIPLTPIQARFFNQSRVDFHHYNQAVMLYSKEGFEPEAVRAIFAKIQEHHDALRITYLMDDKGTFLFNHGLEYPLSLQVFDLKNRDTALSDLENKANEIQAGIDLEKGPLMKLGLFHLDDGDRLLIAIHHLVIDGVSWRILFEDIDTLYHQLKKGEKPALPAKTDSFKLWSEKLSLYADSQTFLKEKTYWAQLESQAVPAVNKDFSIKDNHVKDTRGLSFTLEKQETQLLLTKVNRVFQTGINDILLTALGLAIKKTFGQDRVLLTLEGHGREEIFEDVDTGRTVGWFTSEYPVLMDMSFSGDPGRQVREIKETLRRIPNKGIGYGILKYLTDKEHKKDIQFKLKPQISFNYLGQFDADIEQKSFFEIAKESGGNTGSLKDQRAYELDVSGMITNQRLTMTISYNETHFKPGTMAALSNHLQSQLENIIAFCSSKENIELTPSDFTYKGLTIESIDRLMELYPDIEDLYPLTPMQEGMLFHALVDDNSYSYFEQISYRLQGELDMGRVEKSLNQLFKRHDILRTAFVYKDIRRPLQVVLRNRTIDFHYRDISKTGEKEEIENFIKEFKAKDKARGFDLSKDVLMRTTIFRLDKSRVEFTWSFHHILMDGWCMGILNTEFFEIYTGDLENRPYRLPAVKPYRAYIQWLEKQDKEASTRYWQNYLASFEEQTGIPKTNISKEKGNEYRNEELSMVLNREKTSRLIRLASRHHVTLNTVTRAVWGILLGNYNGKEDVVFGAVVSGRPFELEGVESMVGLFINTIPVRIRFEEKTKFYQLLERVQEHAIASEPHHYHPLAEIQANSPLKQNLLDHLFIFENYPIAQQIEGYEKKRDNRNSFTLKINNVEVFEQTNYDLNLILAGDEQLKIIFKYNGHVYDSREVKRIANHFMLLLDQVRENKEVEIRRLTLLSEEEKNRVLYEFNDTRKEYPEDKTIHELFAEQAEQTPDHVALAGVHETHEKHKKNRNMSSLSYMSYKELNEKSNQLTYLLHEKGVKPDTIAGIMVKQSIEMAIGILAILKAGGAFLPIDPDYPRERIDYMLKDSGAKILLKNNVFTLEAFNNHPKGTSIHPSTLLPFYPSNPYSLAYIIYTSGSTGTPKGTLIRHRSLNNLCHWHNTYYSVTAGDRATKYAGFGFDASVWEIFPYLISGAAIYIIPDEIKLDIYRLNGFFEENDITIAFLPTQVCEQFMTLPNHSLRILLTGGDKLRHFTRQDYRLVNNYGPTENTVVSTSFTVDGTYDNIPIGKPIDNIKIYLLSKHQQLQPIGIVGELSIGGVGLAAGYLNRPELTAEKFDRDLWDYRDGYHRSYRSYRSYIYHTGDLARWLPDGNIEFLGRIDRQVKIRGFRIELGEIENRLSRHHEIKEVAVLAKTNETGDAYLCAYIIPAKEIHITGLREYLSTYLPDYTIPSYFVQMEKIPLTPNGKIDRNALPEPGEIAVGSDTGYRAPTSTVEKKLVEIWKDVLGRDKIGIDDNFFEKGGDSIKTILIAARMKEAGYRVEIKDIFSSPTIATLAPLIKKLGRDADQSVITGIVPLTPNQQKFFIRSQPEPHRFNRAVILDWVEDLEEKTISAIFKKLYYHHDALRMTFKTSNGKIIQENHGLDYPFSLQVFDFRNRENAMEAFEKAVNDLQAGIDLENGPLMKLGLFHLEDGRRLVIIIHQLVIDDVSRQILLEDIETLIARYKKGEKPVLPAKTDSYKLWAEKLSVYADSKIFLKEKTYWAELESHVIPPIKKDFPGEKNYAKDTRGLSFILEEEETALLLTKVNRAYQTEINDILLTSLGLAIKETFGQEQVLIALESPGREKISEDMDINRTVGWFTCEYPVIMDLSYAGDPGRQIKEIKETLRRVPNNGIGYGILKYLTNEEHKQEIQFKLNPQISFHYPGPFDTEVKQKSVFEISKVFMGNTLGLKNQRPYELDVSGSITDRRLTMNFSYNETHFKPGTMAALVSNFQSRLKRIISFCSSKENTEPSPGDFTYKGLSIESIDRLMELYPDMEDLYPLTPMQEGMLFHALVDDSSDSSYSYFQQISYRLQGELDIGLVERSLNELFKRHDILRTAFVYRDIEPPVQVVLKDRVIDFYYKDIRKIKDPGEKENFIKEFKEKDKVRSFDLSTDVLMRVSIIQPDNSQYEFTWTSHHILMDGWCMGIVNTEFFEIYTGYLENRPYRLPAIKPYRNYIQWLEKQDKNLSARYWRHYLDSFEEPTGVPGTKLEKKREKGYKSEKLTMVLNRDRSSQLTRLAARHGVTLNTVAQTVWAILLGKYNGKEDVVFGAVVSGRPFELEGVETMVGLFINTIPVRIRFEEKPGFHRLLEKVQEQAIAGEPHHYHPLAEIQAGSTLKQNLIDHVFIFENFPIAEQIEGYGRKRNNKFSLNLMNVQAFGQTNYDFNVVFAGAEQLRIIFPYNGYLYDNHEVKQVANHFILLFDQVIENEEVEISKLTLLSEEERNRVLYEFNDTGRENPEGKTIHGLFVEQAERTPGHIAVIGQSPGIIHQLPLQITYEELNEKSNRLAALLQEKGVVPDMIVGLMIHRSIEMIIGILGILKSGGAYLPIEPEFPEERIDYMLEDSSARILVTDPDLLEKFEKLSIVNCQLLMVNGKPSNSINNYQLTIDNLQLEGFNLAYIIYTSGSTGRPKGVMVDHRGIFNTLYWRRQEFKMRAVDRVLHLLSFGSDAFITSFFTPVVSGAPAVQLGSDEVKDIILLKELIVSLGVTYFLCVPSLYRSILEISSAEELSGLKVVILGGEPIQPEIVEKSKQLNPGLELVNDYGPTETSVVASICRDIRPGEVISIGKPTPNVRIYIMDKYRQLVPIGIPGEMVITGKGLARGYLNQPRLTAEKFLPVSSRSRGFYKSYRSNRSYLTGDLARWLPDGNIEFLGRLDSQVKVRGFRIELGEIENQISGYDGIKEAVAVIREDQTKGNYVCAYFASDREIDTARIREYLSGRLPGPMIPAYFVRLDRFPLTPSGKVDRRSLPEPGIPAAGTYIAPRNQVEEKLVEIWSEILEVEKNIISIDANFFDLGGHSISATRIAARIFKEFDVKVSLTEILKKPSIGEIAPFIEFLEGGQKITDKNEKREEVLI
jgi:iturin family lipopeptide synthetase B